MHAHTLTFEFEIFARALARLLKPEKYPECVQLVSLPDSLDAYMSCLEGIW